jgi:hypothetical protein
MPLPSAASESSTPPAHRLVSHISHHSVSITVHTYQMQSWAQQVVPMAIAAPTHDSIKDPSTSYARCVSTRYVKQLGRQMTCMQACTSVVDKQVVGI